MQRGIQETTDAMHSNMSSILNRGGKIEQLVQKSDNLITPSKMFKREIHGACTHPRRVSKGFPPCRCAEMTQQHTASPPLLFFLYLYFVFYIYILWWWGFWCKCQPNLL